MRELMRTKKCQLIQHILTIKHEGTIDEMIEMICGAEKFYQSKEDYTPNPSQQTRAIPASLEVTGQRIRPPFTLELSEDVADNK